MYRNDCSKRYVISATRAVSIQTQQEMQIDDIMKKRGITAAVVFTVKTLLPTKI